MEELAQLAWSAGAVPVERVIQRLKHPDPHSYVGKGKLRELHDLRGALDYTLAIFDDQLTPAQQRTLEEALAVKVIDRTALILDIFAQRARSSEGALQVALAQHEYLLPRLAGQWSHLERMEGAIGARGPGETQLETDRRLIRNHIRRLKQRLEQVRRHRRRYRRSRQRAGALVVALVGYTNAGKSTLLNALTRADVRADERLFETLDPVTRRWRLRDDLEVLLTDTVGFIQKLPAELVAAFRATLEELEDADVLLHVVDITHADAAEQSQTVEDSLAELGLADRPRVTALNKADLLGLGREAPEAEAVGVDGLSEELTAARPDTVLISAATGRGLDALKVRVVSALSNDVELVSAKTPQPQPGAARARVS